MVFTHLPSNLLLALIPFAPNLILVTSRCSSLVSLSPQMDVPTRQAFVVAIVDPGQRGDRRRRVLKHPRATSPGQNRRCWPAPPQTVALGAPFVIAGVLKSVYDLAFYAMFRRVKVD